MFLVSVYEEGGLVEASLGGRVTPAEVRVFGEEILNAAEDVKTTEFRLLLDHSRAEPMDSATLHEFCLMKEAMFEGGAAQIVSVARDHDDRDFHTTARLQFVLEGHEDVVLDPTEAVFGRPSQIRKAA